MKIETFEFVEGHACETPIKFLCLSIQYGDNESRGRAMNHDSILKTMSVKGYHMLRERAQTDTQTHLQKEGEPRETQANRERDIVERQLE